MTQTVSNIELFGKAILCKKYRQQIGYDNFLMKA